MEFGLEILGKSDLRLVGGWASVEIVDLEKDYVPVTELAKAMVVYMKNKGGQIFYEHQNKPVGKVIYWDIRKHPTTGKMGIYIIACIDKGYEFDDVIWNSIKEGKLKGFSISGFAKSEEQIIKSEDGREEKVRVLKNIEMMEISLVSKPANQYALIDEYNVFAKGIRTSDIPDMIRDVIDEISDKVDIETLRKIIDIVARYNKGNGNDVVQEIEVNEVEDVPVKVVKSVKSVEQLREILVHILEEAKKVRGFVYHHTQSGAYKGMADDVVNTIRALIGDIDRGIIIVSGDEKKSDDSGESIDKEEGMITTETEGYDNKVAGCGVKERRRRRKRSKVSVVKHYVRIGELMLKVEKMLK